MWRVWKKIEPFLMDVETLFKAGNWNISYSILGRRQGRGVSDGDKSGLASLCLVMLKTSSHLGAYRLSCAE
jgi:hypothetical protein